MPTIEPFHWTTLVMSAGIALLFTSTAVTAGRNYRQYHDDRAAWALLVTVALTVAAMGLLLSASAIFLDIGVTGRGDVRNIGLGIMRGAMLVTAAAFFLARRKGVGP